MINLYLLIWEALCAALFYGVFCRSVRTDTTTHLDLRLSNQLIGTAALVGVVMPLYGWQPDWVIILFVASMVLRQWVAARSWRDGVPDAFVHSQIVKTRKRRAADKGGAHA